MVTSWGMGYTVIMKELQFRVSIHAPKDRVWSVLWDDATFREWAGVIDPGTYMEGELKVGGSVQFISAENGYGVTSHVDEVKRGEYIQLSHVADTQDAGERERDDEWTGGKESYSLTEQDGITTLVATFDVPLKMEAYFNEAYPKAFARVKELAEGSS